MEVKIDDKALATHFDTMVKEQIFAMFTPEVRDNLVKESIRRILEDKQAYGNRTPFQLAMDRVIEGVTQDLVKQEVMNNPAIKEKLQSIVQTSIQKSIFSPEREEQLVTRMTELLGQFLSHNGRW